MEKSWSEWLAEISSASCPAYLPTPMSTAAISSLSTHHQHQQHHQQWSRPYESTTLKTRRPSRVHLSQEEKVQHPRPFSSPRFVAWKAIRPRLPSRYRNLQPSKCYWLLVLAF